MDKSGIGYKAHQSKLIKSLATHDQPSKPKPKKCLEWGQEGHFAHECEAPLPPTLPKHARPFAFNAHYIVRKDKSGKVKVSFMGPPNKLRPKGKWRIWVTPYQEVQTSRSAPESNDAPKEWTWWEVLSRRLKTLDPCRKVKSVFIHIYLFCIPFPFFPSLALAYLLFHISIRKENKKIYHCIAS